MLRENQVGSGPACSSPYACKLTLGSLVKQKPRFRSLRPTTQQLRRLEADAEPEEEPYGSAEPETEPEEEASPEPFYLRASCARSCVLPLLTN